MGKLRIQTLGTSFTIQSDEDDAYLNKLFGYYKKIVDDVSQIGSIKNPLQTAILSGIMICDELYKEKQNKLSLEKGADENQKSSQDFFDDEEIEKRTLEMISKISQVL